MPNNNTSKFAGMIPKQLPQEEISTPPQQAPPPPAPKTRGRRAGKVAKYNNDDYRLSNFYLHVDNYADAQARIRKERKGRDMSDLINELLAEWLKRPEI